MKNDPETDIWHFCQLPYLYPRAALTSPTCRRDGSKGSDLNSGWNCDATKKGCPSNSPISILLPPSAVGTSCEPPSGRFQALYVGRVDLVPVAVPLADVGGTVHCLRFRALLDVDRLSTQAHGMRLPVPVLR